MLLEELVRIRGRTPGVSVTTNRAGTPGVGVVGLYQEVHLCVGRSLA
jgi:hypothetical protein